MSNRHASVSRNSYSSRPATLMAALFLPTLAFAQADQAEESEGLLEEIVVTADKRGEQSAQDLVGSITAFDESKLERLNAVDFDEMIVHVPSTNYIDNGGPGRGYEVASIRGLSRVSDTSDAIVAQYLDGAPRFAANYRMFDIGEVSVLRGPQGTLWGSQSIGGLISFRSNRPQADAFSGRITADGYSTDGDGGLSTRYTGFINTPIIEDTLAFRFAGQYIDETGYVDNVVTGNDDINDVEETAFRAALAWTPTDTTTVSLIYHDSDLSSGAPTFFSVDLPDRQSEDGADVSAADQDYSLFVLEADIDLGWGVLSYNGASFELDNEFGTWNPDFFGFGPAVDSTLLEQESMSHELRLASTGDGAISWIVGYFHDDLEEVRLTETVLQGSTDPAFTFGGPLDTTNWALFGEVAFRFAERWEALFGVRFYEWEVDAVPVFTFFGSDLSNPPGTASDDDQLYKFRLSYDISDDIFVYGLFSQGFRVGGFNAGVNETVGFPPEFSQWNPDQLTNYELGIKSIFADGRVSMNATVYFMDWEDVISVVSNANRTFFINANVPDLEASGFEFETATQDLLAPGVYLAATYSYTENEFTESALIFDTGAENIAAGDELRRTPKHTWSLDAGYDFEIGRNQAYVRANYWHKSETSTSGFNGGDGDVDVPAQDVVNFSTGMMLDNWHFKFYVDNLTDERPFLQVFPGGDAFNEPAVASSVRPRTYGLEVSFGTF